jgi:hypothetical protein
MAAIDPVSREVTVQQPMVNPEILNHYRDFLLLKGHRVIETPSTLWVDVRPFVFQAAPPFHLPPIGRPEAQMVFKQAPAMACRWFSVRDNQTVNYSREGPILYVARGAYDIMLLPHNARHQTRRGLERVEILKQALDDTAEPLAFAVYADTAKRLGLMRTSRQVRRKWRTWVKVIRESRGIEFWAAWHDKQLVAFAVTVDTPWGKEFVLTRSKGAAMNLYPNNAMIYSITKDSLAAGASLVSLGLSAYSGQTAGLHRFKLNMGFEPIPLEENHCWHLMARPFRSLLTPQRLRGICRFISRGPSRRNSRDAEPTHT